MWRASTAFLESTGLKMPLIIMCGYPCSGKSKRAEELKQYFTEHTDRKVHVIADDILGNEKNCVYAGKFS